MAFDLNRSYWSDAKERDLSTTATLSEEGLCMVFVDGGAGSAVVQPSAGAASERFAGFAISDGAAPATFPEVETITVPVGGGSVQLSHTNLVPGAVRAYNNTSAAALTEGASGDGNFQLNDATGVITLHSAQAGNTVTVTYRYNLTLAEVQARFHSRSVNNDAQLVFRSTMVAGGEGEFFTTMFDATSALAVGAAVKCGAGGLVSMTGSGPTIGHVTHVPGASDPMLGIKFQVPVS